MALLEGDDGSGRVLFPAHRFAGDDIGTVSAFLPVGAARFRFLCNGILERIDSMLAIHSRRHGEESSVVRNHLLTCSNNQNPRQTNRSQSP
jgi:hypothetical protein